LLIAASPEEAVAELGRLGFVGAAVSSLQKPGGRAKGGSGVTQLRSEEDAGAFQDWAVHDSLSPCKGVCTIDITEFEVDGIPGAVGIKRARHPGSDDPEFERGG
jgi:hypothetical protein